VAKKKNSSPEGAETGAEALEELSFEQALDRVEEIIERIESGEIGLEESIKAYEQGARLIRRCRAALEKAEQRVETLDAELLDRAGEERGEDSPGSAGQADESGGG